MDLSRIHPWPVYTERAGSAVLDLVRRGDVYDYSGHGVVKELEAEFSRLHGGIHAVSFNSGTSALFAAFAALGVRDADEVLVPNLTFLASASPLLWLGATPVFVDSEATEPSVDPKAIERAIGPRTRAVVVTHLFGNPVDLPAIATICRARGVALVEDCSHAHASVIGSRHVGTWGDAAIYSVGAGKLVSGGHGGVLLAPSSIVRDLAMLIGHFKPRTRLDLVTEALRPAAEFALGGNLRLSPLSAALALDHVRRLDALSAARCANADVLDELLAGPLEPVRSPAPRRNRSHFDLVYRLAPHLPTALRDAIIAELASAGIPASAPSTRPLNRVLRMTSPSLASPPGLVSRLLAVAEAAPADAALPSSTAQHDRMISLPAGRLYQADAEAARWVGEEARRVLSPYRPRLG